MVAATNPVPGSTNEAFEAAAADRDLLMEELQRFRQLREEHDAVKESAQRQSLVAMKGMQKTVGKLEEENERLMGQLHKERERFMEQLKGVEMQLDKATSDNEHLTLCLRRADEELTKRGAEETESLRKTLEMEQNATAEAIAMCEAAEMDNDRLLEEVENLQNQLAEARSGGGGGGQGVQNVLDQAGPQRKQIAELIFGILEDFVEEEDENEKSPVVEDLEKTCQVMTNIPAAGHGESPIGFITQDYAHMVKSCNAFRELLVAATTMAQEAVQQLQLMQEQQEPIEAQPTAADVKLANEEHSAKVAQLEAQIKELDEGSRKTKEAAKTARQDMADVKQQLRRCKNENESLNKKYRALEEEAETAKKELKRTQGQFDQLKLQKREAYNKSRKAQGEREAHIKQIQTLKDNSDNMRREMEMRINTTCQEQEEYANVMCELRSKLERELTQLQREHQLAEENNTALMEDRVNLIAQLTQTKIEAQEAIKKTQDEFDEKISTATADKTKECEELSAKVERMTQEVEDSKIESEDHRTTCEKYRIDLEATLARVSEQADEIEKLSATAAECEELRTMLSKQKQEFDKELALLQNTVEKMEQSAAQREQAMAERAEEALERAIGHARTEAQKQKEAEIGKALRDAQFQNERMHGDAEDKLQQALQHIQELETSLDGERQDRFELQAKLDHARQQLVEGRQRVVEAEQAAAMARSESVRHSAVTERADRVHAASENADRRFGSLPNGAGSRPGSRASSPTKDEGEQSRGNMQRLKKMRRDNSVNKENDGSQAPPARRPASAARKDRSTIKGVLQSYARGVSVEPPTPVCQNSPLRERSVRECSLSISQDVSESPSIARKNSAKMERMATLQRLKQRGVNEIA